MQCKNRGEKKEKVRKGKTIEEEDSHRIMLSREIRI
jgi:hypothetical protein